MNTAKEADWLTDYSDHSNMLAFHFSFTVNIRKYYACKYVHALIYIHVKGKYYLAGYQDFKLFFLLLYREWFVSTILSPQFDDLQ